MNVGINLALILALAKLATCRENYEQLLADMN